MARGGPRTVPGPASRGDRDRHRLHGAGALSRSAARACRRQLFYAGVVRNRGIQLPDAAQGTTPGLAGGLVARSCRLCRAARLVACMGVADGCRDARGGHRYPRHSTPAGFLRKMTSSTSGIPRPGVRYALLAALLFGASTPLAKGLLTDVSPQVLAGLLYLGSGMGLSVLWFLRRRTRHGIEARLARRDLPWLAGAIAVGGVLAPLFLLGGLARTPASAASLLLNLEGVFTALLAWFAFRENVDWRV